MTTDQLIVFGVLGLTLVLFMWNRWRHDIVAVFALLAITIVGLVPVDQAFLGLGHPAVITVAAVLVLSRGLLNAGVVDAIARHLTRVGNQPWIQVATLTGIVALSSSFMNNVGALALFMPVAISISRQSGRSPSLLLMPLAFASLLGGTITMIGTPPNIIIASYREVAGAAPFGMFDFLPVGLGITVCGLAFIALVGWRLTPRRDNGEDAEALFQIGEQRGHRAVRLVAESLQFAVEVVVMVPVTVHQLHEAGAAVGLHQPGRDLEQGGFAGTVAADQAHPLAGFQLETGAIQQFFGAEGDGEVVDAQQRHEITF